MQIGPNVKSASARTARHVSSLRILRIAAGLTQSDVARAAGLRRPTVTAIENGHQAPRRGTALRIAEVLEQPVDLIFPPEGE